MADKNAQRAQQQLELELEAKLKHAVLHAKRKKDLAFLERAIHDAVETPGIPPAFPAVVEATTELLALQNEARMRLKFYLKGLELDKVKANGKVGVVVEEVRTAKEAAEAKGGYGREVEEADAVIDDLEQHARAQDALISKLAFALRATRSVGTKKDSSVARLKTFVDAAKTGGIGLWNPTYVEALRIVDPDYLQSLGLLEDTKKK